MANEFIIKNGYRSQGNSEISGSLIVSGSTNILGNFIVNENTTDEVINSVTRTLKAVGGTLSVDWDNKELYDTSQQASIDWENKTLEEGGLVHLNWSLREAYDNLSALSINWNDRLLFDDNGTNQSVNWNNRVLYDAFGGDVLDWQNRQFNGTSSFASTASYVNPLIQNVLITGSFNITGSTQLNGELNIDNKYYFINTLSDLPTPVSTIITLADNATYVFTTTVDLLGNRLVCGQNTTILGGSSENCRIKSTGLTGIPLISSSYSLPMRGITIEADVALELNASGSTQAIDWFGVNFTDCPTVGLIKNYSNVIMTDCAFLEAANCTFDGTIGTVGFITCLFNGRSGQTIMSVSPTGSITRRFRPIYSSFIALSSETALSIPTSSIANAEGFILDTCNFSGGGTYITGANTGSLKSLFVNNVGITNTTNVGHYFMINNTTNTTIGIPNVNVWRKVAGTTTIGIGNSPKWVASGSNRIDYSGSIAQDFKFTAVGTVQSAASNQVISVGLAKNGTIQTESEVTVRTATANQPYPFAIQDLTPIVAGDYIEVFVLNTNSTDVRVGDLNVIIDKIGS